MSPENDFSSRFLARLPKDVAASFTPDQLAGIQRVFGMRYAMDHAIDLRRTVRLPWGHYYVVLLVGRDWRQARRRVGSGVLAAVATAFVAALVLVGG